MINFALVGYVCVALLLAFLGRRTRLGPILIFLISILLTPVFSMIYLIVTRFEFRKLGSWTSSRRAVFPTATSSCSSP